MYKVLVVVDMQKDFIDGALGFDGAEKIIPGIAGKIKEFEEAGDKIVYTLDTHFDNYMQTQEGKNLPVPHCIKGSEGHGLCDEFAYSPKCAPIRMTASEAAPLPQS